MGLCKGCKIRSLKHQQRLPPHFQLARWLDAQFNPERGVQSRWLGAGSNPLIIIRFSLSGLTEAILDASWSRVKGMSHRFVPSGLLIIRLVYRIDLRRADNQDSRTVCFMCNPLIVFWLAWAFLSQLPLVLLNLSWAFGDDLKRYSCSLKPLTRKEIMFFGV